MGHRFRILGVMGNHCSLGNRKVTKSDLPSYMIHSGHCAKIILQIKSIAGRTIISYCRYMF